MTVAILNDILLFILKEIKRRAVMSINAKKDADLHNWYIEENSSIAKGNVKGNPQFLDSTFIHTSKIEDISILEEAGEVIITTHNTRYHCKLKDCLIDRMDNGRFNNIIELAKNNQIPVEYEIEENSILIVISNYLEYYFDKVFCNIHGSVYEGMMSPHIGMIQDSCLIRFPMCEDKISKQLLKIDIRYFPHPQYLEAYCWEHIEMPVYIQNSGDELLYFRIEDDLFRINPSRRILISKNNSIDDNDVTLQRRDLYPIQFM